VARDVRRPLRDATLDLKSLGSIWQKSLDGLKQTRWRLDKLPHILACPIPRWVTQGVRAKLALKQPARVRAKWGDD
jgi:hypothetical protein